MDFLLVVHHACKQAYMSTRNVLKSFILMAFVFQINAVRMQAQENIDTTLLQREWFWERGWFSDDTVIFRNPKRNDSKNIHSTILFSENGSLVYDLHVPKGVGICSNGLLYLEEASWTSDNSNGIIIYLKGGKMAESDFEYKIVYRIQEISKKRMVLVKEKTLLQKETSR